jgi:pre-mRNA-splicing factor RBM22/SLT11
MKKGNGSIDERIRERYVGINDPVAKKIMDKISERAKVPDAPTDLNISTLFVSGYSAEQASELPAKLKIAMETVGKIEQIKVVAKHSCAFVCFNSRESAERAMEAMFDRFFIDQTKLKLLWAKA